MNPIRRAGVVAFLEWIRRNHPSVTSLRSLTKEDFLDLATNYEASKGMLIDSHHVVHRKWESTQWMFSQAASDQEALNRLG